MASHEPESARADEWFMDAGYHRYRTMRAIIRIANDPSLLMHHRSLTTGIAAIIVVVISLSACTAQQDNAPLMSMTPATSSAAASSEVPWFHAPSSSSSSVSSLASMSTGDKGFLVAHEDSAPVPLFAGCVTGNVTIDFIDESGDVASVGRFQDTFSSSMQYVNGEIYFVTPGQELGSYDLATHASATIPLPGVSPLAPTESCMEGSGSHLRSLLADGRRLYYLYDGCTMSDSKKCLLGRMNLSTGMAEPVRDVGSSVQAQFGMDFAPITPKGDTVYLMSGYGDAGHATTTIYAVDPLSGRAHIHERLSFDECEAPGCSPATVRANTHYEDMFPSVLTHRCGSWTITEEDQTLTFRKGLQTTQAGEGRFLACLE